MTPDKRRWCLTQLGMSQRGLASRLGWDESTVRRWFGPGGLAPQDVDAWLERRAQAMADDPPPARTRRFSAT